jgi:hypothetical protein
MYATVHAAAIMFYILHNITLTTFTCFSELYIYFLSHIVSPPFLYCRLLKIKNCEIGEDSSGIKYIPNLVKIYHLIQNLKSGYTNRQYGDVVNLLHLFKKENMRIIYSKMILLI